MTQARSSRRPARVAIISSGGVAALASLLLVACGEPTEAPRVTLPVVVDGSGVTPVTTDLGYEVQVTTLRVAVSDLVFTVAGEVHTASVWDRISTALASTTTLASSALIPQAHAHPGHYQGGEVTGELRGDFVLDWTADDGVELGAANLIAATYSAANFTFGHGAADTLGDDDPLVGHTAIVAGVATRDSDSVTFTIVVDSPDDRALVGAPFDATVQASDMGPLQFRVNTFDALEGDTLFDAIDFVALDTDGDGDLLITPDGIETQDAYNVFRRVFQTHDHYSIHLQE